MNAYLFCFMLNLAAMFGMCLIAWFVWQGASAWLVLVMLMLTYHSYCRGGMFLHARNAGMSVR